MVRPAARAAMARIDFAMRQRVAAMRPTGGAAPVEGRRPATRPAATMRPVGGAATAGRRSPIRRFNPATRSGLTGAQISEYVGTLRVMTRKGGYVKPDIARWLEREGYVKRSGRGWKLAGRDAEGKLVRNLGGTV